MDQQIKSLIDNEITNNEVCLFMKGTPDAPQCGFSMAVSNMLKILEVKFRRFFALPPTLIIKYKIFHLYRGNSTRLFQI